MKERGAKVFIITLTLILLMVSASNIHSIDVFSSTQVQLPFASLPIEKTDKFDKDNKFDPTSNNLIYTAAEDMNSDIVLNRIGGLADPYNIQLNNDLQDSERADVAVSGNNVYVVWDSDSSEILYRRSLDGGASFSDTVTLSDELIDTDSQNPAISVDGNNVYVVWSDSGTILLRKSTDGGANFGPTIL